MKPGTLRQRIIIQTSTTTTDGSGISTESWTTFATVWASVEPLTMREMLSAAATDSKIDTRFIIRYRSGVLPTMRISYDSKYYNITQIINVGERDRELQLLASEA